MITLYFAGAMKYRFLRFDSVASTMPLSHEFAMQGQPEGLVVLADEQTDRILGVHMIGPHVSELITEAVVAMKFSASSQDIACIVHAHPSLSEVFHEAALGVDKRSLHI